MICQRPHAFPAPPPSLATTTTTLLCHVSMLRTASARFTGTPLARRSITYDYRAISDGQKSTEHPRRPARGGQNLSERYVRLEKSLRQKGARSSELEQIQQQPSPSQAATQTSGALKPHQKPLQYFRGFQIPEEPRPPADDGACILYLGEE